MFVIQKWILAQNISTLTPYSKLWGQSTVETQSPIKGMKKKWKMENEKIIFVYNSKMNITLKNIHSNPIFQPLRSKYSGKLKSYWRYEKKWKNGKWKNHLCL